MSLHPQISSLAAVPAGEVLILEAERGAARRARLREFAADAAGPDGESWVLDCDTDRGGIWAGLAQWIDTLLPRIEHEAPELFERHTEELLAVLPSLGRRVRPRYVTLTESAPKGEAVRNFAADRAYRLGQGVVDLLDEWHRRSGAGRWVVACDGFDRRGALVGRFFRELMRRRGSTLRLTLVAAVDPGEGDAAARAFHPATPVRRARAELPADVPAPRDRREAHAEAAALERAAAADPLELRARIHDLIRLWDEAGQPERATAWRARAMGMYNHEGYYEDSLRHAEAVRASIPGFDAGRHFLTRWGLVSAVYYAYLTNGLLDEALRLLEEEAVDKLTRPAERARVLYQLAMLHVRHLPEKDPAKADALLRRALEEAAEADVKPADRHFLRVFLNNGVALVRHRQGRAQEAVELTREGFQHLDEHLPSDRHRLHRSVLLFNAGQVYASTGALDDAVRSFTEAMEMDPHYSEYYNDRGNAYLKMGRYEDALRDYRSAVEYSSPYAEVWVNLGQCHALMRRWSDAEAAYARALDLDPDRFLAHVGRAKSLAALGRADEAVAEYDAALALEPRHALLYANRAALHFERGRLDASVADLDRAVDGAPDNPALRRNRALALRAAGHPDRAAADLERYLDLVPQAPDRAAVEAEIAELRGALQPA